MPFWKFAQLFRFLHFTNNKIMNKDDNRIYKLRNIINYLNEKFLSVCTS